MTLILPRSTSLGAIIGALAWTSLSFGAALAPAPAAAASEPFYTAELSKPAEKDTVIAGGVAWSCKGTKCVAPKGNSRPLRMCRELQKENGDIAGFTTRGETLAEDELAKCNG
ncbi:MAG: hypothetical protein WC692_07695 [Erythrobacter sp.]|jgi:hypothetical protein